METGVCGDSEENEMEVIDLNPKKKIDIYYVTDPICSHCWAIEPTLRRFIDEYGHYFNFHTVMGGLLEKWGDGPVDPANGIHGPADVAGHWREVGEHFRMPIDGSLMIDKPVQSSFPPSRVFKIIQKHHGDELAFEFLRRARESLFAFNENIGEDEQLITVVNHLGLDGEAIVKEAASTTGETLLREDFALTARLGARGFPTIVIVNENNQGVKIVGGRPLEYYVSGLAQMLDGEEIKPKERPTLQNLLEREKLLFAKEIEVMYDVEPDQLDSFVEEQLKSDSFEQKELLGEKYYVSN